MSDPTICVEITLPGGTEFPNMDGTTAVVPAPIGTLSVAEAPTPEPVYLDDGDDDEDDAVKCVLNPAIFGDTVCVIASKTLGGYEGPFVAMIGYDGTEEAEAAFDDSFGEALRGPTIEMPIEDFNDWMKIKAGMGQPPIPPMTMPTMPALGPAASYLQRSIPEDETGFLMLPLD